MKSNGVKKKRKDLLFFKYVVKKPVVCIVFFSLFLACTVLMFNAIKVPVYKEYVLDNNSEEKLVLKAEENIEFIEDSAIVYYQDRNSYIYTSKKYKVNDNTIEILDAFVYMDGKVYVSGKVEEKSLGRYIIDGSFNY